MKRHFMQPLFTLVSGKAPAIKAVRSLLLVLLFCGAGSRTLANVIVTPATGGTNLCTSLAADGTAPAFTTLGTITISETAASDFGNTNGNWTINMIVTAPTGWSFNTAVNPTFTPTVATGNVNSVTLQGGVSAGFFTVRITGTGNTAVDVITISNVSVRANNTSSANGYIYANAFGNPMVGLVTGPAGTDFGDLSQSPQPIQGASTLCAAGNTAQMSDITGGGVWSATNSTVASVSISGNVTSGSAGVGLINYTLAGCTTSHTVVVNNPAGAFGGVMSVCVGSTTLLSNATIGGTWSSGTLPIATATNNATGTVGGVSAGAALISYNIAACGTTTVNVTVNPLPAIGGPATLCVGNTFTLSNSIAPGVWSSSNSTVATVTPGTGVVTAVTGSATPVTMTYSVTTTGCKKTTTITVNNQPVITPQTTLSVCSGNTVNLSSSQTGGLWSTTTSSVATLQASGTTEQVHSAAGAGGNALISYSVTACPATTVTVTVVATPSAIGGLAAVCQGASIQLSNSVTGGVWSSGTTTLATVTTPGGVLFGSPINTGSVVITYTNGICAITKTIAINTTPQIGGASSVCTGATTQLTDNLAGGVWTSSNTTISTVSNLASGGDVSGVSTGNSVITYTLATGCFATHSVTVNQSPNAIGGVNHVCENQATQLSDNVVGGTWSSSTSSVATITPTTGNVSGITAGVTNITFTEPVNGCFATTPVTVNATPSIITGLTTICVNDATSLSDTSPGGAWSSDNTTVATIDVNTGLATGLSGGTSNITYAFGATCFATTTLTVNPLPDPGTISGSSTVCQGAATQLSNSVNGGTWSSDNNAVATVSASGLVSGVLIGTANISYTLTNGCGTLAAVFPITVQLITPAVSITPSDNPSCLGLPVTFTATATNGGSSPAYEWRVNGVISATTNPFSYTPVNNDHVVVKLTSNAGCLATSFVFDSVIMVVNPNLVPSVSIASNLYGDTVCVGTLTQFTATPVNGGSTPSYNWYVNGSLTSTANPFSYVPNDGDIVSADITSSYQCATPATVNSNSVTMTVDIVETPMISITASANPSCENSPVTFTAHYLYGGLSPLLRWTQAGINVATGPTYTTNPANADQFYCVLKSTASCRTLDSVFSNVIIETVDTAIVPIVSVTAAHTVISVGQNDTLVATVSPSSIIPIYQWYLNGVAIPGANAGYYVATGASLGVSYYYCIVTNGNACHTSTISNYTVLSTYAVGVNDVASGNYDLQLVPNPNSGNFIIQGTIASDNHDVKLEITNAVGQVVYRDAAVVDNQKLNKQVSLGAELPNGVYLLHVVSSNAHDVIRFSLNR